MARTSDHHARTVGRAAGLRWSVACKKIVSCSRRSAVAETKKRKQLKTFPGLAAAEFQHPHDAAATEALASVPGLDMVVSKVLEYGLERIYYLENLADNVRVTERMLPRLHRYLGWGCRILDVEEPELYVNLDPVPNAYTFGHKRPFIVLTSGLIDLLGDEELLFTIGHELGHIKAGHVLYTMLARNIAVIVVGDRAGDAGDRRAARAGAGRRAARLVPQGGAHLRPRGPALRAGSRPLRERLHEAGRRRRAAVGGDGPPRVPAPDRQLRGGGPLDAGQGLQDLADRLAHAPLPDPARQGAARLVRGGLRGPAHAARSAASRG